MPPPGRIFRKKPSLSSAAFAPLIYSRWRIGDDGADGMLIAPSESAKVVLASSIPFTKSI